MKKILSTTLAAIALSIVMVSTVDARQVRARKGSTAAAPQPQDILLPAKDAMNAKKDNAPIADQKEAGKAVAAALTDPNMTPEQKELVAKRIEQADLERDIRLRKNELADINYGWFGFGTTTEQQESYRKSKADLVDLNAKLKDVNTRIRELERLTGRAYSNAVKIGIGAAAAVGISLLAYAADQYAGGEGLKYIKTNIPTWEGTKKRFGEFQEGVSRRFSSTPVAAPDAPVVTESDVVIVE
jgi:hypothetical protein